MVWEHPLLSTNRQIRHEALPIYYGENTFEGPLTQEDHVWLGVFGDERAKHIRCFYWDVTMLHSYNARRLLAT